MTERFVLDLGRLPSSVACVDESAGRAGIRVLGGISAFWVVHGLLSDGL